MDTIDSEFTPPHCPNSGCEHHSAPQRDKWFKRRGLYSTKAHGFVQRYICLDCKRGFSRQTFDLDYYSKKRVPWTEIATIVHLSASDRSFARVHSLSPTTVGKKISRLAKWALLRHQNLLSEVSLREDLAADGFETFAQSQYTPCHINFLAGSDSQFVYSWDYAHLRRKGRMTKNQKAHRSEIEKSWRAYKGDLKRSFIRGVTSVLIPMVQQAKKVPVCLNTDEHPVYPGALDDTEGVLVKLSKENKYKHRTFSSKVKRDRKNPLFAVNYIDREIRKDVANHVRETTRYSRNPNALMERLSIYFVMHNTEKRWRIAKPAAEYRTHAEAAGLKYESGSVFNQGAFVFRPRKGVVRNGSTGFEESALRLWERAIPVRGGHGKYHQAGFWSV